ncbi:DNA-processing protein DprA [Egibacter rhizosphaerae]|uniref:DNA-processing protein DprA n=1 Tax=Egibacter rhizosphaerae TaxID=1670831 RepID=A0A411YCS3_9ACTN|nr:DNA-protecting protein DprA [Egibacter rhizosphaerae]QBI18962.1 DNA-processing protein DprA [Egibacter rhizosphaerae]
MIAGPGVPHELAERALRLAEAGVTSGEVSRVAARLGGTAEAEAVLAALERRRGSPLPAPAAVDALRGIGGRVELVGAPGYPARLATLWPDGGAPLWLFTRVDRDTGDLPQGPAVAVVGTRTPTAAGIDMARWIGRVLARAAVTVVSGLARGIDQAAHEGALAAGGATVGVLGAGLDVDYPRGDGPLRARVAAAGGLVTELPCGCRPRAWQFLARNRIIAGMTDATVVVEGRSRSGALATAQRAAEQGREVYAVPGSPLSAASAAPNELLRDGAIPVTCPDDVLSGVQVPEHGHVGPEGDETPARRAPPRDALAREVWDLLGAAPTDPDALVRATGRMAAEVLGAVARLVTEGFAERTAQGIVAR